MRDLILKTFPGLEPDDVKSTSMGAGGEDIQLSPAARKILQYNIECKNKAKHAVYTHYEQAKSHGKYEPLLIIKMDRKEPLAIVSLEHFIKLIQENKKNESSSNNPQ